MYLNQTDYRQAARLRGRLNARALAYSVVLAMALSGLLEGIHAADSDALADPVGEVTPARTAPAEVRGLFSALRDPSEPVRDAVADYPAALRILPAVTGLGPKEIEELVALWLEKPAAKRIQLIAAHPDFAAEAAPEISRFLTADTDPGLRTAVIRFFERNPSLINGKEDLLAARLDDLHGEVRAAALALLKQQPQIFDALDAAQVGTWLADDWSKSTRLLGVKAITQRPELAIGNETLLVASLGSRDSDVRAAALDLLTQQPQRLDALDTSQVRTWLADDQSGSARLLGVQAIALRPELAVGNEPLLVGILIDSDSEVQAAALALMKQQPRLFNALQAAQVRVWLADDQSRSAKRAGVQAIALRPELAIGNEALLAVRLGDSGIDIRIAALALLKQQPQLLDALTAAQVRRWLADNRSEPARHASVQVIALRPELAVGNETLLAARLVDSDRSVRAAALELTKQQPRLFDALYAAQMRAWLTDDQRGYARRVGVEVIALRPELAVGNETLLVARLVDSDGDVRTAALALVKEQPRLLDALTATQVQEWLADDGSEYARRAGVEVIALRPELAVGNETLLAAFLGDRDRDVRAATLALLKQQSQLVDALDAAQAGTWLADDRSRSNRLAGLQLIGLRPELAAGNEARIAECMGELAISGQTPVSDLAALRDRLAGMRSALRRLSRSGVGRSYDGVAELRMALRSLGHDLPEALAGQEDVYDPVLMNAVLSFQASQGLTVDGIVGPNTFGALIDALDALDAPARAAYELLEQRPRLFDAVDAVQVRAWLADEQNRSARLAGVQVIAHRPELAIDNEALLAARLADADSGVQAAARQLFRQNPVLITPGFAAHVLESRRPGALRALRELLPAAPDVKGTEVLLPLLETCNRNNDTCTQARLLAHLWCGGGESCAGALRWLGDPEGRLGLLRETATDAAASRTALARLVSLWDHTVNFEETRKELADVARSLVDAREDLRPLGHWSGSEDLGLLKALKAKFEDKQAAQQLPTGDIDRAISRIESGDKLRARLKQGSGLLGAHAAFWLLLVLLYPRFPMVQALFFWNPWIRRIGGLVYVGLLLAWVPWLRRLLFQPFRESLLADAALAGFQDDRYYPNSLARPERSRPEDARAVGKAIARVQGQIVLSGESGLGKTMFLRHLVSNARRVTVYLPAWKCRGGVLEAIQRKLHGPAKDPAYLRTLIYAGAVDLCIDGINEVGPSTRAEIRGFAENLFKGNIIMGVQPGVWDPPSTAVRWILEPLRDEQIEEFLISRGGDQVDGQGSDGFAARCRAFVRDALSPRQSDEEVKANREALSNPMDASIVADMLARGDKPNLLALQKQWYWAMAEDFQRTAGRPFPLERFAEQAFQMRLKDDGALPQETFPEEVKALVDHKMAKLRVSKPDEEGDEIRQWQFRHDKVWEYFIVQAFLGADNDRPAEYMHDQRFRGVYFLLAWMLPEPDARALREQLIQYAAATKDHSVSDDFIRLLRSRELGVGGIDSVNWGRAFMVIGTRVEDAEDTPISGAVE